MPLRQVLYLSLSPDNFYFFFTHIYLSLKIGPLIRSLGLCVTSTVRERVFLNILQDLKEDTEKKINYYKENNYLKMVNWEHVKKLVGSQDLEDRIKRLDDDLNKREEIEMYT